MLRAIVDEIFYDLGACSIARNSNMHLVDRRRVMAVFKCNSCGNTIDVQTPPEICPACKEKCEFVDVSCYIPECGGPDSGNINPQVFQESFKADK
jgi:ABC-type ATPase with predicted acetyltransferase domain